jgi:ornithine cyclodeaminase/alanine dehydrogenase-like protein (mu-crystallin family)
MMFLDEERVEALLRWDELLRTMEKALIDFSAGRVTQPVRTVIPVPEHAAFFGIMPAIYGDVMGTKLVSVFPRNADRGLHTHLAIIHLIRADTGEPLAAMDGRVITAWRTAAVSAVATKVLSSEGARVLAILGSGVQARTHLHALKLVRNFEEIRIWSRTPEHAKQFAAETGATFMSAEQAVRGADVIVTVTNAAEPVLRGTWLKDGAHVNAVGAVGPKARELDDDAMKNAAVVVESREAALQESGEIMHSGAQIYAELGEVLMGKIPKPQGKTIVFKSLGIAVEDVAAGELVYRRALAACEGQDGAI